MKRDLAKLANTKFDVLVIGGGIYGATAAWEAASRGLKVALIEKTDFAAGTSSNSLKIIHGGLRYLQHADFKRMRESVRERRILMNIAPHLISPLPCVMPTFGHSIKGPEIMRIALLVNDIISLDRNKLDDKNKHMPCGKVLSRKELIKYLPFIDQTNLTGGALWYDAQVHNPERLVLDFIKSAVKNGAEAANYTACKGFIIHNNRVTGIHARDEMSGDEFDIQADVIINNAGPWINTILSTLNGKYDKHEYKFSTAFNLVVRRKLANNIAFGFSCKKVFRDKDAIFSTGSRLFFAVPWRSHTLIGTDHAPYHGHPEAFRVTEEMIGRFLDEANSALPGADIKRDEIAYYYGGLLPMTGVNGSTGDVQLCKHFQIIDHQKTNKLENLITVLSVKFTTARDVAEKTIDLAVRKLQKKIKNSLCEKLAGAYSGNSFDFRNYAFSEFDGFVDSGIADQLIRNYGLEYKPILQLIRENPLFGYRLSESTDVIQAEIINAVQNEMALTLKDVVLRRTELGSAGCPDQKALENCAAIMAKERGWSAAREKNELAAVQKIYIPG